MRPVEIARSLRLAHSIVANTIAQHRPDRPRLTNTWRNPAIHALAANDVRQAEIARLLGLFKAVG
jgi:hypothetical protein